MPPELLYLHLVSHCEEFGTTTLELHVAGSPSAKDIGLLINIDGESVTTPELSELMKENKVSLPPLILHALLFLLVGLLLQQSVGPLQSFLFPFLQWSTALAAQVLSITGEHGREVPLPC